MPPAGCSCLRLRKAARRVSQIYDLYLKPYDLSVTQYSLLGHVRALDGINIGALAQALVMDPTTLTRNLKPLERRKLLVLVPDVNDKRSRNLHLTDAGREIYAKSRVGWEAAQNKIAVALGDKGQSQLTSSIDHLLQKLAL